MDYQYHHPSAAAAAAAAAYQGYHHHHHHQYGSAAESTHSLKVGELKSIEVTISLWLLLCGQCLFDLWLDIPRHNFRGRREINSECSDIWPLRLFGGHRRPPWSLTGQKAIATLNILKSGWDFRLRCLQQNARRRVVQTSPTHHSTSMGGASGPSLPPNWDLLLHFHNQF